MSIPRVLSQPQDKVSDIIDQHDHLMTSVRDNGISVEESAMVVVNNNIEHT